MAFNYTFRCLVGSLDSTECTKVVSLPISFSFLFYFLMLPSLNDTWQRDSIPNSRKVPKFPENLWLKRNKNLLAPQHRNLQCQQQARWSMQEDITNAQPWWKGCSLLQCKSAQRYTLEVADSLVLQPRTSCSLPLALPSRWRSCFSLCHSFQKQWDLWS